MSRHLPYLCKIVKILQEKPSRLPLCHNKEGIINHNVSLSLLDVEGILLFFSMCPGIRKSSLRGMV